MSTSRLPKALLAAATLWLWLTGSACLPVPQPGPYETPTPFFYQQTSYWCMPATLLMWHNKWKGVDPSVTQQSIWDWATYHGPGGTIPGVGMNIVAAEAAAQVFVNPQIRLYTYSGSAAGRHQAMADIEMGLRNGNPTIVAMANRNHAIIFTGTSWRRLADAIQRPTIETVKFHDPWFGSNPYTNQPGGPNVVLSFGYFMNYVISNPVCAGCVTVWAMNGQQGSGDASLDDFNDQGGRYLGPTPANPTGRYMLDGNGACYWEPNDSGPDQCGVPPPPTGRYKWSGSQCYWDPNDSGPNQCTPATPPTGRYKWSGSQCYWDPNDSGPNQCTP